MRPLRGKETCGDAFRSPPRLSDPATACGMVRIGMYLPPGRRPSPARETYRVAPRHSVPLASSARCQKLRRWEEAPSDRSGPSKAVAFSPQDVYLVPWAQQMPVVVPSHNTKNGVAPSDQHWETAPRELGTEQSRARRNGAHWWRAKGEAGGPVTTYKIALNTCYCTSTESAVKEKPSWLPKSEGFISHRGIGSFSLLDS